MQPIQHPAPLGEQSPKGASVFVLGSFIYAQCWGVPRLPECDESQRADHFQQECAGKGLAVALGCHRLGAETTLLMAIGNDHAATQVLSLLQQEGMSRDFVVQLPMSSGHGCGLIDAQGKTSITVYPGANACLDIAHFNKAQACLVQSQVVYAQCEAPLALVTAALQQGKTHGILTVLNPSPWCDDISPAILNHADILIVNRQEAGQLLRHLSVADEVPSGLAWSPEQQQALWKAWHGQWLVITLGSDGCIAYSREGEIWRLPAHRIALGHAIGAGDAFSAGLCTALAEQQPMQQALAMANACGAAAASGIGILTSLPSRPQASAFLTPQD